MNKKTILITGAGSGLGKEASITLARRGHHVIATTRYQNEIGEIEILAKKEKLDMEVFKLDIEKEEDRKKIQNYDIDIFISNSAIGDSGSVSEINIEKIKNVFYTNVFCNIEFVQQIIKKMISQAKGGRIIFLSSLAGRIPIPFLSPYCASKAAIDVFATCLREEIKLLPNNKIEIAIIEPGAYATGFNKENNEKKYTWMEEESYFKKEINFIKKWERKFWNLVEIKPYSSIISRYVKVVETNHLRARYSAPVLQTFLVQMGRILGL